MNNEHVACRGDGEVAAIAGVCLGGGLELALGRTTAWRRPTKAATSTERRTSP